ncbi:MAG: GNAT family N-acetyltransferase [Aquimonas sp.]|nr:GNAT family N-acetyltransferase [Aquimonas sp.]
MDFTARFVRRIDEVDPQAWDSLRAGDDPFTSHAFLAGLETEGCIDPGLGWTPHHLLLEDAGGRLRAAAPAYLKTNSHGEFVFDHAWANAYQRAGLTYYPKLLVAVPYSPVTGPRLLCGNEPTLLAALRAAIEGFTRQHGLSGAHVNFHRAAEAPGGDWLLRHDLQFHWHNRGYRDFPDFLDGFQSKKRKNLRQERAQVARAGVQVRRITGDVASPADIEVAHRLYCRTFEDKGNHPALSLGFFRHLARSLGPALLLVLAERGGQVIAGALCLRSHDTLYGRYWGCFEEVPGLHFEACYHQGIEFCIEQGLARFEPGAQGEHKLARGFLPVPTRSSHYLPMPAFREAVAVALDEELRWLRGYRSALLAHAPFREEVLAGELEQLPELPETLAASRLPAD